MIDVGLSPAQQRAFHALLTSHHSIDVQVRILDLDHKHLFDVSNRLVDGQVTVDAESQITRGLDIDLLDPSHAIHLDSDSPNAGAMFADRMVRIVYRVIDPEGTVSYRSPVFTGPITKLERTGAILKVECQGKEIFGLVEAWRAKTFKRGMRVTTAIRLILSEMMGESKMSIPDLRARLPRNVSVGEDNVPWEVAKKLAGSIGFQLFYDGSGEARMRRTPTKKVFVFRPTESLKTEPEVGFSIDKTINAVEVWGKKPKKGKDKYAKKRPHARVVLPRNHPLSPWSLGRADGPRYLPRVIENDSIRTDSGAKALARAELKRGAMESIDVAYDTLVVPHLEEMDVVRVETNEFAAVHRVKQFAIPLTADGDMSVGYVRRTSPNRRAIRLRKKARAATERKNR